MTGLERLDAIIQRTKAGETGGNPRPSTARQPNDTQPEFRCQRCRDLRYLTYWKAEYEIASIPCPDCLPPPKFTFENFQPVDGAKEALKAAKRFSEGKGQPWLILIGTYGCGKTHIARGVVRRLQEKMIEVRYIYTVDLLDNLKKAFSFKEEIDYLASLERVYTSPSVLVLDDLGAEKQSEWARERLEKILNRRYEAEVRTMITSNCTLEELPGAIASRMSDRHLSRVVFMTSNDYRKQERI